MDVKDISIPPASNPSYTSYMHRPARRHPRHRSISDSVACAPFIALPPLEKEETPTTVEFNIDGEVGRSYRCIKEPSESSISSQESDERIPLIFLPPVTRPIDLTTDHSAYNPAEVTAVLRRCNHTPRAISAGLGGGIKRVAGSLAVTRALGDAYLKTPLLSFLPYKIHAPYITARPEVNFKPIAKDNDKVLVLATDGVWERAGGEDILRWVRSFYAERVADTERQSNRRLNLNGANQSDRAANEDSMNVICSEENQSEQERQEQQDDKSEMNFSARREREQVPCNPNPVNKRRKRSRRSNIFQGKFNLGLKRNFNVADVIVPRILNKVRRACNIYLVYMH